MPEICLWMILALLLLYLLFELIDKFKKPKNDFEFRKRRGGW